MGCIEIVTMELSYRGIIIENKQVYNTEEVITFSIKLYNVST